MNDFLEALWGVLILYGLFLIVTYWTPYMITKGIREAMKKTPIETNRIVNVNLGDKS